ncbi:MAG TPA: UDP-N-acetylmuramate dehydrogenase [Chloroflexota bacterium]|nr:UDP-N-acetylmuramate dehydrogenase [Chloroflexota bacterium]
MSATGVTSELLEAGLKLAVEGEPMSRHTSWRIGGPADYLCLAEDERQLLAAIEIAGKRGLHWLVLGGGNNVLVADEGIEGLVILNRLRGIRIEQSSAGAGSAHELYCGAGVFFARAAQYSARRGYTGMEWGIAIPGTIGGGVVNNAGAHWLDVNGALISADILQPNGSVDSLTPIDLAYHYRQSALKTPYSRHSTVVVTGARFRLQPDDPVEALRRVAELREHRLRTQPVKEASAGSTFKNPAGEHAGALIDRAGLKGHRIGGAQIAPLHANFILNVDNATAGEVISLIRLAQSEVEARFGVWLEPEVQFIGRWPDEVLQSVLSPAA